ncbi:MAG TPA: CpsD/CapB family tyrosine-protein kinase [Candidatus Acidoferrum sp.]|nr:CpsD/CapB family tyrosine-protein kinase [Candidatus Acidoferrum sp.]
MSRIHEALKKAQEERAAQQDFRSTSVVESTERPVSFPSAPTAVMDIPVPTSSLPVDHLAGPLTFDVLLARCPQMRWNPDPSALVFINTDENSEGKEVFRTLRTRLYQVRAVQPLKTVIITSALPGEGKTFVTSNLAQSLIRQRERRVLLIDADLRVPNLHTPLGAPISPGLSDYLLGEVDEIGVLQRGRDENLFLISGGKTVPNPNELLANGRLERLLERLGPAFDWILMDSPPTIPVSDTSILAKMCDGLLMVVRAGSTPFDLAQKACQEFNDRPLLGAVLNRADKRAGYGGYYYQGYSTELQKGKS